MRFVPANDLKEGMVLAWDIINPGKTFILKKGIVLTKDYIRHLREKGYLGAYIDDPDSAHIIPEESVSPDKIIDGIKSVENVDIEGIMSVSQGIVADMEARKTLSVEILDLRSFDDYTYHHSVNVAIFAVAVGKYIGLSSEELVMLAQAGLSHDLGKEKVPISILNKRGRLTDEELELIQNHPKYSYDILYENHEISAAVRQAVICHHENENGSGYPNRLTSERIPPMAKILHAVDVYDALITRRPYKEPYTPADALEYMMGGKGILFDEFVIDAMLKVIPPYPVATEVVLSNGQHAIVAQQTEDPYRPCVKIIGYETMYNLSKEEYKDIIIVASGIASLDHSRKVEKLNEDRNQGKEHTYKIMVVDDSAITLQQVNTILSPEGYEMILLQSGIAAINYIREKGIPDLVIMDIEMPNMNGISTVSTIRKMGYDYLPVVFLTARGDKETVIKCIKVRAKDYIVKPVRPPYLKARIAIALNAGLER